MAAWSFNELVLLATAQAQMRVAFHEYHSYTFPKIAQQTAAHDHRLKNADTPIIVSSINLPRATVLYAGGLKPVKFGHGLFIHWV